MHHSQALQSNAVLHSKLNMLLAVHVPKVQLMFSVSSAKIKSLLTLTSSAENQQQHHISSTASSSPLSCRIPKVLYISHSLQRVLFQKRQVAAYKVAAYTKPNLASTLLHLCRQKLRPSGTTLHPLGLKALFLWRRLLTGLCAQPCSR